MSNTNRHLAVVPDQPGRPAAPRVRLTPSAALALDRADHFLLSLEEEWTTGVNLARASYLLGTAEAHIANLSEMLHKVVAL